MGQPRHLELPYAIFIPLHPDLARLSGDCGFKPETTTAVVARGYLTLVDIVVMVPSQLYETFEGEVVIDINRTVRSFGMEVGSLPYIRELARSVNQLHGLPESVHKKMRAALERQCEVQPKSVGSLTLLSLALYHGFDFTPEEEAAVNVALAPYNLLCRMLLTDVFKESPANVAATPPV